jgi:hypothetical protein
MSLTHAGFAVAGLIAAVGPVIVHLLNRRRYRTVEWGAMAFLRKALHRTRRAVRLRDLLLLVLRTAAILLFGLALARPFFAGQGFRLQTVVLLVLATVALFSGLIGLSLARSGIRRSGWGIVSLAGVLGLVGVFTLTGREAKASVVGRSSSREPVHAVFVIDNSRSMGVRSLGGTLLDAAKQRVETTLGGLPQGSRISVLPLCGPEKSYTLDAYSHAEDARAALERIEITDRAGSALRMLSLATEAARRVPEITGKRVVFVGDQQAAGWPASGVAEAAKAAELPVQVAQIGEASEKTGTANLWIESFAVQDGLAEADLPTTFLVTVRCEGKKPVNHVELTLEIDGKAVADQTVDLRPGQSREIVMTATVDAVVEPGAPRFVNARLSLRTADASANRLDRDDARVLAVPVVTAVPVVFIDEYGEDESLDAGRVGETYRLRRLLAPRPAEGVYQPLVAVRHLTIEEVDESSLADARLVVVAGVERPTENGVRLLRQYVEQGGPLVIAAGANFDPAAWSAIAWRNGDGILPVPLKEPLVGLRPSQAVATSTIEPFRLDTSTLDGPLFSIAGERSEALSDLWGSSFFFQAVDADASDAVLKSAVANEASRIAAERKAIAAGAAADAEVAPAWLRWKNEARSSRGDNPDAAGPESLSPETLAARSTPRVLARFGKTGAAGAALPYLVERRVGYGRVLLLTSGISSDWDTLSQTNAIVLLDRITRSMIEEGLPRREFEAGDTVTLTVERRPDVEYRVAMPNGERHPLVVDATGHGYVVRLEDTSLAGSYDITSHRSSDAADAEEHTVIAVNGPVEESKLVTLSAKQLADRVNGADVQFVAADQAISLAGGPAGASGVWKWGIGVVLACLAGEMIVAGKSRRDGAEAAA